MKTLFRCLALAIAIASLLALSQRHRINVARTRLAASQTGAAQMSQTPLPPSISLPTQEDIARLRAENRDIYKLRGEISQAREKRKEIERLQAENAQFREQIQQLKANPQALSSVPFPLLNKGQSTPAAALETAYWSMYHGDLENLSRSMPMLASEFETQPPAEKTNSLMMLKAIASAIEKLEILDQKSDSPDEAQLTVRFLWRESNPASRPEKQAFDLRRNNGAWQIIGEHSPE